MTSPEDPLGFDAPGFDLPGVSNTQPALQIPTLPTFEDGVEQMQSTLDALHDNLKKTLKSGRSIDINVVRTVGMMVDHAVTGIILDAEKKLADSAGITLDEIHLLMSRMPEMASPPAAK